MVELGYPMSLGTLNYKVAMDYLTPCWYGHLAQFVSSQVPDVRGNFYNHNCYGSQTVYNAELH